MNKPIAVGVGLLLLAAAAALQHDVHGQVQRGRDQGHVRSDRRRQRRDRAGAALPPSRLHRHGHEARHAAPARRVAAGGDHDAGRSPGRRPRVPALAGRHGGDDRSARLLPQLQPRSTTRPSALRGQFRTVFTGVLSRVRVRRPHRQSSRLDAGREASIRDRSRQRCSPTQGVEAGTVGISQIVLPPKTSSAVLSRMQATRDVLAEGERNIGTAEAEAIRSAGNNAGGEDPRLRGRTGGGDSGRRRARRGRSTSRRWTARRRSWRSS